MDTETHRFADDGRIPNSTLPLLVYRAALTNDGDLATAFERRFAKHGWTSSWRNGIFAYHHFHSTSHEVLGIARGSASVRFGGPQGSNVDVHPGDAIVIPAGVGHKLEQSSADLLVVGAYPDGRDWDVRRGDPPERADVMANLAAVPLPASDPVQGMDGELMAAWTV